MKTGWEEVQQDKAVKDNERYCDSIPNDIEKVLLKDDVSLTEENICWIEDPKNEKEGAK